MSRTDRHRPHQVQVDDPYEQRWYWFDQGLNWGWAKTPYYRTCNCRWCGMHFWRIQENRQRRHDERRRARLAVKGDTRAFDER